MRMLLTSSALALALTGAAMADGHYDGRDHSNTSVTVGFGDVAVGYRDGYQDNEHRWHRWHNRHDYRDYGREYPDNYRNRYSDRGDRYYDGRGNTAAAVTIGFGNVAFGYRDGYWDNGHRWHGWSKDRDYQSYRSRQGANFHNWNHDRDSDQGWQRR